MLTNAWPAAQRWWRWPHPAWHVPPRLLFPLPSAPALPSGGAERGSWRPPGSMWRGQAAPPAFALPRPHSVSPTPAWCPRLNRVNTVCLSLDLTSLVRFDQPKENCQTSGFSKNLLTFTRIKVCLHLHSCLGKTNKFQHVNQWALEMLTDWFCYLWTEPDLLFPSVLCLYAKLN